MAVRRESVRLELEDHFSTGMAKAAAAAKLLHRELDDLDGTSTSMVKNLTRGRHEVDLYGSSLRRQGAEVDRFSGRVRILADTMAVLGPGLVPTGGVAVAGIAGLSSQLGFAAIGMGSLVAASQGVGDALKTLNDAALDPTAANLEKAREAMDQIGPAAQGFVTRFQELRPVLRDIRDAAAQGWFPGLTDALDSVERVGPEVASLFEKIGTVGGNLVAEGAAAFAGLGWSDFRDFIGNEAPRALTDLGHAAGNTTRALAELWMAFGPLNRSFSTWLVDASRGFAEWADGLSGTQGFQEFVTYIRENGPKVADALVAVGDAVVQIVEAIAPLGGPSLQVIESFAKVIGAIADSDLGTPILAAVSALALLNRTMQVTAALQTKLTGSTALAGGMASGGMFGALTAGGRGANSSLRGALTDLRSMGAEYDRLNRAQSTWISGLSQTSGAAQRTSERLKTLGKGSAVVAGLAVATTGLADGMGLSNTASLALMGTIAGPWGAAIGGGVGLMLDLAAAADEYSQAQARASAALQSGNVEQINAALVEQKKILADAMDSDQIDGVGDFFSDLWRGISGRGDQTEREEARKKIGELENALDGATRAGHELVRDNAIAEWAQKTGDAFINLATDFKAPETTLANVMDRMEDWGRAALNMGENIKTALKDGADPEALQNLIDKLGPEAGLAIEQLATGGKKAAGDFNRAWAVTENGLVKVQNAIMKVGDAIQVLPDGTVVRVSAETRQASTAIQQIIDQARQVPRVIRTDYIVNQINSVNKGRPGYGGTDRDPTTPQADGGFWPGRTRAFASGGFGSDGRYYPRESQIVMGGANILWGEQETGWEAYISGKPSQRNRNVEIWAEAGRRLGIDETAANGRGPKRGKNKGSFLGWDIVNQVPRSLNDFINSLEASRDALQSESDARTSLVKELGDTVGGKFTSTLFGDTDVWSKGGSLADAIAILNGDAAAANAFNGNVSRLQALGLDDAGALNALLAQADAATIASIAATATPEVIAQYEQSFQARQAAVANAQATAMAAQTATLAAAQAATTAELVKVNAELKALQQVTKGVGPSAGKATADANNKGAGRGARNRNRSALTP